MVQFMPCYHGTISCHVVMVHGTVSWFQYLLYIIISAIQPPRIELCPSDSTLTTSEVPKNIPKPRILFRTASGSEAPYTCSHFGEHSNHNFTLGVHVVTCTAFDPKFGDKATAVCRFTIHVKGDTWCVMLHNGIVVLDKIINVTLQQIQIFKQYTCMYVYATDSIFRYRLLQD